MEKSTVSLENFPHELYFKNLIIVKYISTALINANIFFATFLFSYYLAVIARNFFLFYRIRCSELFVGPSSLFDLL